MSKCPVCGFIKDAPRPETGGDVLEALVKELAHIGAEAHMRTPQGWAEYMDEIRKALLASQGQGDAKCLYCARPCPGTKNCEDAVVPCLDREEEIAKERDPYESWYNKYLAACDAARQMYKRDPSEGAMLMLIDEIRQIWDIDEAHPQPAPGLREALEKIERRLSDPPLDEWSIKALAEIARAALAQAPKDPL
jgi:hypothetical protein